MSRHTRLNYIILTSFALGLATCVRVPRTTAYDPDLPRTEVNGYAFHTEVFGTPEKAPLLVIHGGPGGDFEYLRSLSALQDEYFVMLYDQRGTGLSPREDPAGHTVERFVQDLDELIRVHGSGRPVRLVGHSWGAMLATAYIAAHPERVTHVVLAEPGLLNPAAAQEFFERLKEARSAGQMLAAIPAFLTVPFVATEDGFEREDYVMTKLMGSAEGPPYQCPGEKMPAHSFRRTGYASFNTMLAPLMEDPTQWKQDLTIGVERYRGHVLLLSSECSFIGYEFQERHHRARFGARAEHIRLPKAGHNMFTIRPAAALAEVRRFFRK